MKIVFAGKFESALIRSVDEVLIPDRNSRASGYYAGLNRHVSSNYFDRCSTFIAIADRVLVPSVDWNYPIDKKYHGALSDVDLGVESTKAGGGEWDNDTKAFVELALKRKALSPSSRNYISNLTVTHLSKSDRAYFNANLKKVRGEVARHYLCRLFLQLRAAREETAYLVLSEEDIQIVEEIGNWVAREKLPTPFDLPYLRGLLIEPESFGSGLLNFSPPDIRSVSAVRSNNHIRAYAQKINTLLVDRPSEERERKMLAAMVEANEKAEASAHAEKVFEIMSWVVKPLHYVPGVDAVLSVAEDLKDLGTKWLERDVSQQEWYLMAPKMSDIAIRDFLNRKGNLLSTAP